VVCACGNGTAGAFAPKVLERMGVEVIPLDCELDHSFPRYNPNPEDMEMLHAMRDAVLETGADVALGFDGDGDRCGVVDNEGNEIFADKVGVMLARFMSAEHRERAIRGRCEIDRPVHDRSGAAGATARAPTTGRPATPT
jgi:phosphomannomutase/phosphoglucomutase